LREAALVAEQLEKADILPLVPEKPSDTYPKDTADDFPIRVQVSTKALEAAKELSESLSFRADSHCAQQPLPLRLKITALCLPALPPAGLLLFIAGLGHFRSQGFARKVRDWKRWSFFGFVAWAAILLILIRLAT